MLHIPSSCCGDICCSLTGTAHAWIIYFVVFVVNQDPVRVVTTRTTYTNDLSSAMLRRAHPCMLRHICVSLCNGCVPLNSASHPVWSKVFTSPISLLPPANFHDGPAVYWAGSGFCSSSWSSCCITNDGKDRSQSSGHGKRRRGRG
jgi:hypothetical protein